MAGSNNRKQQSKSASYPAVSVTGAIDRASSHRQCLEQTVTSLFTLSASLRTHTAMLVHTGVSFTLIAAQATGNHAGL
jgi:hypothetical protein